mmetsp:Transcript_55206/g.121021  ORF Transcript_55206/g.121021 Transcript_55206/m.121021 type:complete len:100 (+) Transcript_55206:104-403(+)|eukprot:CAMPEP_0204276320 /NCGR_PEP_ID=MMETSP0468-20130131/27831_1 /ASSEMBLY_ACC=CAM_ASM_000383 /TAXON_ID=2969 /ORGANISM="Oxyrrhis marina" /LENGTH=99 /DNA_ID=CAMNT_0051252899 /DNA_START=103 /DNA_END=402 /DNA_ORIENTATION=-
MRFFTVLLVISFGIRVEVDPNGVMGEMVQREVAPATDSELESQQSEDKADLVSAPAPSPRRGNHHDTKKADDGNNLIGASRPDGNSDTFSTTREPVTLR